MILCAFLHALTVFIQDYLFKEVAEQMALEVFSLSLSLSDTKVVFSPE
jgi:hypothetical protein